jgi:hypothetical protein
MWQQTPSSIWLAVGMSTVSLPSLVMSKICKSFYRLQFATSILREYLSILRVSSMRKLGVTHVSLPQRKNVKCLAARDSSGYTRATLGRHTWEGHDTRCAWVLAGNRSSARIDVALSSMALLTVTRRTITQY